jgi:hypothetical protein
MDSTLTKIIDHLQYTEQHHQNKKLYWNDFVTNYRDLLEHPNMARFNAKVIFPKKNQLEIFEKIVTGISLQDKMATYSSTKVISDLQ